MSAPKVGDRVRVIAGQWTGWEGVVLWTANTAYVAEVRLDTDPTGRPIRWVRVLPIADLTKVLPTTPENAPVSDPDGSDVREDAGDAHGATGGVER